MSVIFAIDLGKFNSVFCWYDPAAKSATLRTVCTGEAEFREVLLRQPVVTECEGVGLRGGEEARGRTAGAVGVTVTIDCQ